MILSYNQCLEKYKTKYSLKKAVDQGDIYYIEKGVYSDLRFVPELQVISFKYPNAIFTMDSAFYFYDLTDVIPEKYHLATRRGAAPISDERVKQIFENSPSLEDGVNQMEREGAKIRIYSKERMLVELIRNKNKLPFDYYKEILGNYRRIIYDLDFELIKKYSEKLPKTKMVMNVIQSEVF